MMTFITIIPLYTYPLFIAVHIKDLLFTHDGNKTFIHTLVNFEKIRMITVQVSRIMAMHSAPLQRDPSVNAAHADAATMYVRNPPIVTDVNRLQEMVSQLKDAGGPDAI